MFVVVITMLVGVAVAGAVGLYVAYPLRGEETPLDPRIGEALRRGVEALPVLEDSRA